MSLVSPSCGESPRLLGQCLGGDLRDLSGFYVIMFFWKDRPQSEGRRHADPGIKTEPDRIRKGTAFQMSNVADWEPTIVRSGLACRVKRKAVGSVI